MIWGGSARVLLSLNSGGWFLAPSFSIHPYFFYPHHTFPVQLHNFLTTLLDYNLIFFVEYFAFMFYIIIKINRE